MVVSPCPWRNTQYLYTANSGIRHRSKKGEAPLKVRQLNINAQGILTIPQKTHKP